MLIFTSCKKNNNSNIKTIEVNEFPFTINIYPFQESKDDIFNFGYVDLKLIDDYIVVADHKSDKMLRFLDKKSLNYLFSEVSKGKGPNELLLSGPLQVKENSLFLLDEIKKQLYQYDINKLNSQDFFIPERKYNISITAIVDAKLIEPNSILVSGWIDDGLVCIYDSLGSKKKAFGNVPDGCPKGYHNTGYFNRSNLLRINLFPNNRSFIVSSLFSDKLQVFTTSGIESFDIIGPDFTTPKFIYKNNYFIIDDNSKFGYVDVEVKEKYIYGLYSGFSQTEMMKGKVLASSIFVFKHNGTPIGRFNLDRDIKAFDIDETNGLFYMLQLKPTNQIFKYRYEIP